jgi:hypothetical protein
MMGGELRVGTVAMRITPLVRMPMAGYYHDRASEGVHDDLFAKAIVSRVNGAKAARIACHIVRLPRPIIFEGLNQPGRSVSRPPRGGRRAGALPGSAEARRRSHSAERPADRGAHG